MAAKVWPVVDQIRVKKIKKRTPCNEKCEPDIFSTDLCERHQFGCYHDFACSACAVSTKYLFVGTCVYQVLKRVATVIFRGGRGRYPALSYDDLIAERCCVEFCRMQMSYRTTQIIRLLNGGVTGSVQQSVLRVTRIDREVGCAAEDVCVLV